MERGYEKRKGLPAPLPALCSQGPGEETTATSKGCRALRGQRTSLQEGGELSEKPSKVQGTLPMADWVPEVTVEGFEC